MALLHALRANDRLAISKLVSSLTKASVKSPLAQCLLVRCVCVCVCVCVWSGMCLWSEEWTGVRLSPPPLLLWHDSLWLDLCRLIRSVSHLCPYRAHTRYSPFLLAHRYVAQVISDSQPGSGNEQRPFYDFLESCLRHKAEMVIFEAARAICNLKDVTARELAPVREGGRDGGARAWQGREPDGGCRSSLAMHVIPSGCDSPSPVPSP